MNYEKIGSFIATKRKEKNLTQKQLASLIGVTDKAVSKWERGLGCPDVSILEILANTLDTSILEILKGRTIENEVIKVTEANDYVKETLAYSNQITKSKIKKFISNTCIFLIVLIGSILILLNINNLLYLNYKEYYNFDNEMITNMKENVKIIEKNNLIIQNNKGIYSDEDYQKIIDNLDKTMKQIRNFSILNYSGEKYLNLNDLYIMDLDYYYVSNVIDIYEILSKYDSNMYEYNTIYKDTFMVKAMLGSKIFQEPNNSYKYNLYLMDLDPYFIPSSYRVVSRICNYRYQIDSFLYLTKNIIKVGEINE